MGELRGWKREIFWTFKLTDGCQLKVQSTHLLMFLPQTAVPQVDPSEDMSVEEAAVHRALASVFGMMEKTARLACEQAEQLAAPSAASSAEKDNNGGSTGTIAPVTSPSPVNTVKVCARGIEDRG